MSHLGLALLGFGVNDAGTLAQRVLLLLVIGTIGVGGLLGRRRCVVVVIVIVGLLLGLMLTRGCRQRLVVSGAVGTVVAVLGGRMITAAATAVLAVGI